VIDAIGHSLGISPLTGGVNYDKMCEHYLISAKEKGDNELGFTGAGWIDIMLVVIVVLLAIVAGLYFLNRWASKRVATQQDTIEKTKQAASIYVIDKKHDKAANVKGLPKVVMDNLPKASKLMKMYFVKAKIGPQIMTLMCEKTVYNALDVKKTFHVEMAGIYIASVKGMKTKYELKQIKKAKKAKAKEKNAKK